MPATITNRSDLFELYFFEEDLPISTARVAKSALNRFDLWLSQQKPAADITTATKLHVMKYVKKLEEQDGLSPVTALSNLVHLRRFYAWAVDSDYGISTDPTKGIKKRNTSRANLHNQPVMSEKNYQAMLRLCPKDLVGRRDKAILSLLWHSGLRRSEVAGLSFGQWRDHPQHAFLIVGRSEAVNKNGNTRKVPLHPETAKLIRQYVWNHRKGADLRSPLFASRRGTQMKGNGIHEVLQRALERAGIDEKTGVHSFRRAWARAMAKAGLSRGAMMKIGGWEDEGMVDHYLQDRDSELALEEYFQKVGSGEEGKARRAHLKAVV